MASDYIEAYIATYPCSIVTHDNLSSLAVHFKKDDFNLSSTPLPHEFNTGSFLPKFPMLGLHWLADILPLANETSRF